MRGKLCLGSTGPGASGSIPARAGETPRVDPSLLPDGVHPRACGGKRWAPPRLRGCAGSIPARAGETPTSPWISSRMWVHPRACGGNPLRRPGRAGRGGPSPRVRGKLQPNRLSDAATAGPSPRVRGKLSEVLEPWQAEGSIPARAGETATLRAARRRTGVHPRACGGNHLPSHQEGGVQGPSPRVRGKPHRTAWSRTWAGSIPARAGETPISRHF